LAHLRAKSRYSFGEVMTHARKISPGHATVRPLRSFADRRELCPRSYGQVPRARERHFPCHRITVCIGKL
jgi:hypothetical protein